MRLTKASLILLLALSAWFLLDFIGIDRLVQREPLASLAGAMLALLAIIVALGLAQARGAALLAALALGAWSALQVETHWSGYLLGASERKLDWYERVFGGNWRILPSWQGHTVPDAYHTVLFALLLAGLASALRDAMRRN